MSTNFGAGSPGIPGRNSQDPTSHNNGDGPTPTPGSPQSQIPRNDEPSVGGDGASPPAASSPLSGHYEEPVAAATAASSGSGTTSGTSNATSGTGASSGGSSGSGASGAADAAKGEASDVASHAGDAGKKVAGTAKEEASNVVGEAGSQAKQLLSQARDEAVGQASEQQARVASGLRSISTELTEMGEGREDSGLAAELVRQAGSRAGTVADWLENREPGDLLEEVKDFARRKPGVFIGVAAIAGIAAGRITKAVMSADDSPSHTTPRRSTTGTVSGTSAGATTAGTGAGTMPGATTGPGVATTPGAGTGTGVGTGTGTGTTTGSPSGTNPFTTPGATP